MIHKLGRIGDVVKLKSSTSSKNSGSSLCDMMERSCTLDGFEEGSDHRHRVAHIFHKREKKEMFVVMEKSHLQLMFLKDEATLLGDTTSLLN